MAVPDADVAVPERPETPRPLSGSLLDARVLATSLVAASLLAPATARAQADAPSRADAASRRGSIRAGDPVLQLTDPDASPAARAVEGALLLASFVAFDHSLRDASLSVDSEATRELAETAEWFGDWQASLPWLAGGAAAVGTFTEGSRGLGRAAAVLGGVFAGSMANEGLNRAVGRSRPLDDEGAFEFRPFTGHASFPSGHTAYVFSAAAGIDAVTDGWVPAAAAYGVATLTGVSRIYHDKHWLSDVVVGAAVGTIVSFRAARRIARWLGVDRRGRTGDDRRTGAGPPPDARSGAGAPRTAEGYGPRGPTLRLLAAPALVGLQIRF